MSPGSPSQLKALIIAGGPGVVGDAFGSQPDDNTYVIAADSGLDTAETLGIDVDVVIGDFDSVSSEALERARTGRTELLEHSRDKDETDLELAIAHAQALGIRELTIIGAGGGRIDHELAGTELCCSPRWRGLSITVADHRGLLLPIFERRTIPAAVGAIVTLIAIGGPAIGVKTTGLRWKLDGETLLPGSTRGVSNVATTPEPTVSVESGTILGVLPSDVAS